VFDTKIGAVPWGEPSLAGCLLYDVGTAKYGRGITVVQIGHHGLRIVGPCNWEVRCSDLHATMI